jgi:hypothetical protein
MSMAISQVPNDLWLGLPGSLGGGWMSRINMEHCYPVNQGCALHLPLSASFWEFESLLYSAGGSELHTFQSPNAVSLQYMLLWWEHVQQLRPGCWHYSVPGSDCKVLWWLCVCHTSVIMTLWPTLTLIHDITTKYPKPIEQTKLTHDLNCKSDLLSKTFDLQPFFTKHISFT